jgi:HD-like signal output (HDOD) protein
MSINLTKLNRLPSLPIVAVRLLQRFADPDVSLASVTDIIRPDPAITANILRAASSAEFGVGRPLSDLTRAVSLLGVRRVASLALCFSLSEDSMRGGPLAGLYKQVWLRSIVQAIASEALASRRARGLEAEHFTAGLLSEIGRLAFLKAEPLEYSALVDGVRATPERESELEVEKFGLTHSDLAIALFRQWRLPAHFSEAVRLRFAPVSELEELPSGETRPLIHGVAMATTVGSLFCDFGAFEYLDRGLALGETLYGMTLDELEEFLGGVRAKVAASADIFKADASGMRSSVELMAEARRRIAELSPTESLDSGEIATIG